MFTGIVEELGSVVVAEPMRLTIRASRALEGTVPGDSIAVNGVCLTVSAVDADCFSADVITETLRRTSLGDLRPGDPVNLERAVTPATRLGGHLVQGHVDGVGRVVSRSADGTLTVSLPDGLDRYLVEKGSITVDGVSLTVVTVTSDSFSVGLIPETLARTTLGRRDQGDAVNLEVDVIAKYVEKLVGARR